MVDGFRRRQMARHFSLPTVFRMVPNELLQEFFRELSNPCYGMDWEALGRRQPDPLVQLMQYFDERQRGAAELILRRVFLLACQTGHRVLRDVARLSQQAELLERVPEYGNLYHQAMWFWLEAPDVFERAALIHELQQLNWWRRRDDVPGVSPRTDEATLERFAEDLSRLLMREQGRGRRCTVEHCRRDDGVDYFCCFPDDFPQTVTIYNREGRLRTRHLKPTFDIVFAYRRDPPSLELSAQLPARLKLELERSFAWLVLDTRLGHHIPQEVYDLDCLKQLQGTLPTDPRDRVLAELRRMRLALPDHSRRITLESKHGVSNDVFAMAEEYLNMRNLDWEDIKITLATFRFQFERTDQRPRGTVTFDVSVPDSCSLNSQSPEREAICRKHLESWRVIRG